MRTLVTLWYSFSDKENEKVKCDKYEFCEACINREFDPFQCDTCDDGSNFDDGEGDVEEMSYKDFIKMLNKEAA